MGAVLLTRLKKVLCLFRGTDLIATKNSEKLLEMGVFDKGAFVQLL